MCAHACMLTITVATPSASVSRRQFDAVNDIASRVTSPTAATVSRAVCLSYCLRAYSRQHTCNPFKHIYTYICVLLIGLIMHIIFRLHGTDSSVARKLYVYHIDGPRRTCHLTRQPVACQRYLTLSAPRSLGSLLKILRHEASNIRSHATRHGERPLIAVSVAL